MLMRVLNENAARFLALVDILNIDDIEDGTVKEVMESIVFVGRELAYSKLASSERKMPLPSNGVSGIDMIVHNHIKGEKYTKDTVEWINPEEDDPPEFLSRGKERVTSLLKGRLKPHSVP